MSADASGLVQAITQMADEGSALAAATMFETCLTNVPVDTGETRDSGTLTGGGGGTTWEYQIGFATPQAAFTNDGTRAHTIEATNAKVLRFNVGGVTVYARSVEHPGYAGTGWFSPESINEQAWAVALAEGLALAAP